MTAREAIEALTSGYLDTSDIAPYMEAIIKALEKQVPQKPIETLRLAEVCIAKCPVCGWPTTHLPFCGVCGQAIDWSDLE